MFCSDGSQEDRYRGLDPQYRAEEFDLFLALLDSNVLQPDAWTTIHVFITPGLNQYGGRSAQWWAESSCEPALSRKFTFRVGVACQNQSSSV